ncbi:alpha/beta-hydrolase [Leucogyrophana mollusca]|uniref:Alpha/beta-hydrolase n=1 Tax=Leucogyrophana mollusca TaxID=85980 RepID=A0ACB8BUH9_9AGAM|nr:alpha/beta-hydrolase [Leucogyrophana mollusca]
MVHELRYQPFRGLYLTYQLFTTTLVRFPLWFLLSLPKSWRPRASWTLKRCLQVRLIRHLSGINDKVGPPSGGTNHLAIHDGPGVKALWINPVPELIYGELLEWASTMGVEPIRIPGYWIDREGLDIPVGDPLQQGEKILYRIHGGGFVGLSAHPTDPSTGISRALMQFCAQFKRTFTIEYRLSKAAPYSASNPFPAALFDSLAGYNYLTNVMGINPSDIIVEGDSAGGNLALALVRYLVESQNNPENNLPAPPGGVILLSPWIDLSVSHETPGSSMLSFAGSDTLGTGLNGRKSYPKIAYLGALGNEAAESNRFISPASLHCEARFLGFPRTFINAGGAELLVDQIRTLRKKMAVDMGEGAGAGQVTYYEAPDGVHVYPAFDFHEPERSEAYTAIAEWVASV